MLAAGGTASLAALLPARAGAAGKAGKAGKAGAARKARTPKGPVKASFYSRPDLQPPLVETTQVGAAAPGYVFVTPSGPLIVDDGGSPIWCHPVPKAATNLQVQQYQGQPVLTWWEGDIAHYGVGLRGRSVIMDTSYRQVATVQPGNGVPSDLHEFTLTDQGTALLTGYKKMRTDLSSVGGPKHGTLLDAVVQEVDVATGNVLLDWRSSDHIPLDESYSKYPSKYIYDPVHVNSICVLPDNDLLISARNTWAVYKVGRQSGEIVWRLGGKASDFTLGPGVRFAWQHHARWHPGNVMTVFDDEGDPPEGPRSRGLILNVDEASHRVSLAKAYVHPGKNLLAGSQGSVELLDNGDVFVGWGSEPYFTEFRGDGSLVLDGHFATGQSYRAFRYEWTGTPAEAPVVAVERTAQGLAAYASWNGATEVVTWDALGGSDPTHLAVVGSAPRQGFETAIAVTGTPAWLAARALDATGATLATSKPVQAPST